MGLLASVPEVAVKVLLLVPATVPRVPRTCAVPSAAETALAEERLPPPVATAKSTAVPATGLLKASTTRTTKSAPRATSTVPVWLLPLTYTRVAAAAELAEAVKDRERVVYGEEV